MPDTILRVELTSEGASEGAEEGTYPITVSGIRFVSANSRRRYSVRYNPGTMTVSSATGIAFVRKDASNIILSSTPQTFTPAVAPTPGHAIIVFVTRFTPSSPSVAGVASVKNGFGDSYTRVGGAGYAATWSDGGAGTSATVTAWYKVAGMFDEDVVVTLGTPGGADPDPATYIFVMEYSGASIGIPVSDQVTTSVTGSTYTNRFSGSLDLNNTAGQLAVSCTQFDHDGGGPYPNTLVPSGAILRYDGETFGPTGNSVIDKSSLSGLGPVVLGQTFTDGLHSNNYATLAVALTQ